jgi:subtilisin family serine protease
MADLLRGLDEAWKQGARVVNLALVGPPDPVLERAVDRMRDLGVLLVAAAGNDGRTGARYPAAYPSVLP